MRALVVSLVLAAASIAAAQPSAKKPAIESGTLTAGEVINLEATLHASPGRFDDTGGALVVKEVVVGGPWAALGVRAGDTLLALNGVTTATVAELKSALALANYRHVFYLEVVRRKKPLLLRRVVEGGAAPTVAADPKAAEATATTAADEAALAAKLDAGIRTIDATTVEIDRALVDELLANPMAMVKGARVMPSSTNGTPDGFKLYAVRPRSVYARIGLTNGDRIARINGLAVDSMDRAMEVYTKVRNATRLEIELVRRGKPLTLVIVVR